MREKMDGILFICQTTHHLKNWNRNLSYLSTSFDEKTTKNRGENHQPRKAFSKKDQQQHFCLYCNDFMEVLTNKMKSEKKMYKNKNYVAK